MSPRIKNSIYSVVLILVVFLVWKYRNAFSLGPEPVNISGETMGTTYNITVFGDSEESLKADIDSLLKVFNKAVNTYDPRSEISRFNNGHNILCELPYLPEVVARSREIYRETGGYFDPTVMPLINAWGFGPGEAARPDSSEVDSMLAFVGMKHIQLKGDSLLHLHPSAALDFSAIAKGQGVDVVAEFLEKKGYRDHFVEIGGEVRTSGENIYRGTAWRVGIIDPRSTPGNARLYGSLRIKDRAMATSGNYYNYIEEGGVRYSHTLDPNTGYPTSLRILSASVLAEDCMTADALATAFMAMGHVKAMEFLEDHTEVDAVILYSGENGEIKQFITEPISGEFDLIEHESE